MGIPLKNIVEGLLFISEDPLTPEKISGLLEDVPLDRIRKTLDELKEEYDELGRAFNIKLVAKGYQFRSIAELSPYILMLKKKAPARLSKAALETLAIIAYRQPCLRAEIERIRGVDAGSIIRNLIERDLVRIVGRKDLPGRPILYGTTKRFLEVFDLPNLEALPTLEEIDSLGQDPNAAMLF